MTGGPVHDPARALRRVHDAAVATLSGWSAPDAAQERLRLDYLAQLAAFPDAVAKDGPPAHLTASCLVLDASLTSVLLTHHRKADAWFQFGGHLEPGDRDLRAGATREAEEESGLSGLVLTAEPVELNRHALGGSFGPCREHLDVRYAAVAPDGARPSVSAESHDVRWWPVDALPGGPDSDLRGLVAAALRALAP